MNLIRKKSVRRAISTVTGLTMVVWMCGLGMLAPVAGVAIADDRPSVTLDVVTIYDGDLISSDATNEDGTPTYESLDIYIAKVVSETETYKRLVLNPAVFNSYGHLNWDDVMEVDQSVMDDFITSDLARQDGTDEVYSLVADDDTGTKHWVNLDDTQFVDEAGADPDSIYTINSTDNGSYTTGAAYVTVESFIDRTPPTDEEVGTGLTLALASDTPAASTLPTGTSEGATGVVVTNFNVSASSDGDVTIQSLKVYRTGIGAASSISKVYLYEGDTRLTTGKTINSTTNQSTFTSLNYLVSAGTTKTLSILVDLADAKTDNHAFGVQAAADITTDGAAVSGSFPITGNTMSLANLGDSAYGTVVTDRVGSATYTRKIGEKEAIVAKFTILTGNENSEFRRLSVYNSNNDVLDNMTLWRSSEKLADATENGRYFDFVLDTPNSITKGETITYTLKADVTSDNVTNTANLYIKNDADILVVGDIYGYGVDVDNTGYDGSDSNEYTIVALEAGDITITSSTPGATEIVVDQNDVVLMNLSITALNDTRVEAFGFDLTATGGMISSAEVEEVEFVCEGIGTISSTSVVTAETNWTDEWDLAAGETYECFIRVDLKSTAGDGDTISAAIDISEWTFRDVNTDATFTVASGNYNVVPSGDQAGYTMTVADASLTVVSATMPASQNWVAGGENVPVAGYAFTAGSSGDILIQDVTITSCYDDSEDTTLFCGSNAGNVASSVMLAVHLYDGDTLLATKGITSGQIAFTDLDWNIPAGTTRTLTVKANLNTNLPADAITEGSAYVTLGLATGDLAAYYDEGNKTLTTTSIPASDLNTGTAGGYDASSATKQKIYVQGILAVDVPTSTPVTDIAVAGASDVSFAELKFTSGYEDYTISKIALKNEWSTNDSTGAKDYDDNIANISVKYPTNGDGSETDTTLCTLSSGIVSCSGMTMFVPNPDTAGYNNYAILEVIVDMNTITAGANAADVPEFTMSLAGDFEAVGNNSGAKKYEQDVTLTDVDGLTGVDTTLAISGSFDASSVDLTTNTDALTALTVGDIIYTTGTTDGTEKMYVSAVTSTTTFTVVRGVNGTTAADNSVEDSDSVYVYGTADTVNEVLKTNPMNVQGTKITVANQMSSKTGSQNTTEEIMEFTLTADAVGDAQIRKGDQNDCDEATDDFNTAGLSGTWAEVETTDLAFSAETSGEVEGAGHLRITEDTTNGTTEAIDFDFDTAATVDLSAYTGISFWVRSNVATTATPIADHCAWIFTTEPTPVGDGTNINQFSITTENDWQLVEVDFTSTTADRNAVAALQWESSHDVANGQTFDIDNVILYKEKITVDLTLNVAVTAVDGGIAYLKQNGAIVADGNVGWEDTDTSTSTGAVVFTPYDTYGDIDISGTDTFTVEIDTSNFVDSVNNENLTATVVLGNSSGTANNLYWYDVEGSDNVTYTGVNASDKISTTIKY